MPAFVAGENQRKEAGMGRLTILGAIAVLVVACTGVSQAQGYEPKEGAWRVAGSYEILNDSDADDLLGDGWNIEIERSFANLLNGDLAATFVFRRFDKDITILDEIPLSFSNDLNNYDLGIKWRGGNGAMPYTDGFYYGWGLGISFLDSDILGSSASTTKLSWRLLAGVDFARSWYGEVSYNDPGSVQGVDLDNWGFAVGYRF